MTHLHPSVARARRAGLVLAAAAGSLVVGAPAADASVLSRSISYSTFPADYNYDGGQPAPNPGTLGTGYYYGSVSQEPTSAEINTPGFVLPAEGICGTQESNYDNQGNYVNPPVRRPVFSCSNAEQLRGGAALKTYDGDNNIPVSLAVGDVLRVFRQDNKATVFDTTVVAAPPVTSSVIGTADATISRNPDSTSVNAYLERRVARAVERESVTPGTYTWRSQPTGTDSNDFVDSCSYFDYSQQKYISVRDVAPAQPTTPAPAGETYYLDQDTECRTVRTGVPGAPYVTVGTGRLTAATATSYSVNFGTAIQPGDVITYSESRRTTTGEATTEYSVDTTVPVGVVPPAPPVDKTAPVIKKNDLGAPSTSIKTFLKSGLFSFITLDEPGTVTQQLLLPVDTKSTKKTKKTTKKAKSKAKKSALAFAPKKKSKTKTKTPAAPIVLGTGTATTTTPNETAKVAIYSTKEGRKALKGVKAGKPVTATLVTTVKDTLGNTVTSQAPFKLSGK